MPRFARAGPYWNGFDAHSSFVDFPWLQTGNNRRNPAVTNRGYLVPVNAKSRLAKEKKMNKKLKIGLAALALIGTPLTYNMVMAQQTGTPSAAAKAFDYSKVFIQKLATALGIDQAKLEAAIKTAGNATVDEALKNQDITKDQATRMKAQVASGGLGLWGRDGRDGAPGMGMGGRGGAQMGNRPDGAGRGMGNGMMGGGMMGAGISQIALLESAAKALNLSITQLDTELRSGKTLTEIATAQKVSLETVKNAVLGSLKTQLAAAVKAGSLTQAQADQILKNAETDTNFGLHFGGRGPRR
jgi:DNA-binding CsgD family transcriptional regulator